MKIFFFYEKSVDNKCIYIYKGCELSPSSQIASKICCLPPKNELNPNKPVSISIPASRSPAPWYVETYLKSEQRSWKKPSKMEKCKRTVNYYVVWSTKWGISVKKLCENLLRDTKCSKKTVAKRKSRNSRKKAFQNKMMKGSKEQARKNMTVISRMKSNKESAESSIKSRRLSNN